MLTLRGGVKGCFCFFLGSFGTCTELDRQSTLGTFTVKAKQVANVACSIQTDEHNVDSWKNIYWLLSSFVP